MSYIEDTTDGRVNVTCVCGHVIENVFICEDETALPHFCPECDRSFDDIVLAHDLQHAIDELKLIDQSTLDEKSIMSLENAIKILEKY